MGTHQVAGGTSPLVADPAHSPADHGRALHLVADRTQRLAGLVRPTVDCGCRK